MRIDSEPEAHLDPWCVVPLKTGESILFGYALRHPRTRGLSWTMSTPLMMLDESKGRAISASGRLYALGRRFDVNDIRDEGLEAWVAYGALLNTDAADQVPEWPFDWQQARRWVTACKMARHLGKVPPPFRAAEYELFIEANHAEYCGNIRSDRLF